MDPLVRYPLTVSYDLYLRNQSFLQINLYTHTGTDMVFNAEEDVFIEKFNGESGRHTHTMVEVISSIYA